MSTGKRLRRLSELTDRHIGREVTINDLTGTLTGLIPVGDRVIAALIVGRARAFTDALPGSTEVEVQGKGSA